MAIMLKEIMTRDVEVARPGDSLKDVAQRMKSLDVGMLPICDGDKLVGTITDRDISVRGVAEGKDPKITHVSDIMTSSPVLCCFEDDELKVAARKMHDNQIRRLPVLDREKHLVGIVSLGDIALHGDERTAGDTLEGVSEPNA